jgi:arylsulfatase A-like enzyme
MKKKPNILILYSDQHSARALGCYGNNEIKTPCLDKLARQGVVMDNAFCNNPICTPSRISMLSGLYLHNFGYYGLMGKCPENLPNMFEYLEENGYANGAFGKIHTPAGWVSSHCDRVADGYGFENPVQPWNENLEEGCQGLSTNEYAIYLAEHGLFQDRDDKVLQEWFEQYGHSNGQCVDARPSRIPHEHSFEQWSTNIAKDFVKKQNSEGKPFFAWLTLPRPHQTYAPSQKFWDLYDEKELTLPPNADDDMSGRSRAARETQDNFQNKRDWIAFGPDDFGSARRRVLHGYYGCVSQMDDCMGQMLDLLDELEIAEDTLVVYLTDHGEFAGEHGMIEKAPGIGFGCVTKIPMIWRYPGCKAKHRSMEMVEGVDVFPTLCELAGLPLPNWVDGCSLKTTLEEDIPVKELCVTENPHTKTIHTKEYKLTQYLDEFHDGKEFGELYDRINDPWELHNLYFDPEYKEIVQDLRFKLYQWLIRTTRIYTANPKIPVAKADSDVSAGYSWDLADYYGIYDRDGRVGQRFTDDLIKKNKLNYL